MLGLLLIYWIGNSFFKLSERYRKSKWSFAMLGVVVYYGAMFATEIILVLALDLFSVTNVDALSSSDSMIISILSIPFGLLACWDFTGFLKADGKSPRR